MTNRLALFLGLIIVAALAVDLYFYGTDHLLFLAKKFTQFIEWLKFWR